MIKWSVQQKYTFQLVPTLKKNKLLKLLLVDMRANSRILMRLEMAGMVQYKQKCPIFIAVLELE